MRASEMRSKVDRIAGNFTGYQVEHIDRRQNEAADALSRLGSNRQSVPPNVFLDELHNPSVKPPSEIDVAELEDDSTLVAALHEQPGWTEPYMAYLSRGVLPDDEIEARKIIRRSKAYTIINNEL